MKTGILFTASVTHSAAMLKALAAVGSVAAARDWGHEVRWAALYPPLADMPSGGVYPAWLPLALRQMKHDGFTHVVVQPLQVVNGSEFEKLKMEVGEFQRTHERIPHLAVGAPLLGGDADLERVVGAALAGVSGAREPGDAVILLGHGSPDHAADRAYLAADRLAGALDRLAFVGCVNGIPDRADVVRRCGEAGVKRALLLPFTLGAGATVRAALANTGAQSWVAALAARGIGAVPILTGLGENDAVAAVWLDHAETAMKVAGGGA